MSLGAAFGLAVLVVVTMFVLVFVMAGVETRMFDDVTVTPDAETTRRPSRRSSRRRSCRRPPESAF